MIILGFITTLLIGCKIGYVNAEEMMKIEDCEKRWICYIISTCSTGSGTFIERYRGSALIKKSCAAILKYHGYNDYKATIVLESFDPTIKVIELVPRKPDSGAVEITYQCKSDATTNSNQITELKSAGKISIKIEEVTGTDKPLKCEFTATSKSLKVMGNDPNSKSEIKVGDGATPPIFRDTLPFDKSCDPKFLVFNREDENIDKLYAKFNYKLGLLSCSDDNVFKLEVRLPGADKFLVSPKFECDESKIKIDGVEQTNDLMVRCAADASYGCAYDLKYVADKQRLHLISPDLKTAREGSLKCPPTHKYLVVGNHKPTGNSVLKCKNHGRGVMKWTTADGKRLTEFGPEVYCTDKLSCKPISLLSVTSGYLKQSFPSCYEDGKMSITDGNESFDDLNFQFKCDTSDGLNKFTTGNTTRIIKDATKFTCSYPDKASAKTAKNKAKVIGAAIAGIIAFSIVAPLVVWLIVIVNYRRNVRKHKELAKAEETKEYNKFIAEDDDQKKTITSLAPSSKKVVAFSPATERKFAEMTKFLYVDIEDQMEPLPDIPVKEFNDVRDVEDVLTKRLKNDKILSLESDVEESIRYLAEDCKKIEKEKKEKYKKKKEAAMLQQQAKS